MASSDSIHPSGENLLAQIAEQNSHDLARANLLRMRGDYPAAIEQCLSVLKRAPEDPDAHTLIGDIYAEQGNLGQAAQWYELALDLNPESAPDRQKLTYVQQRINDREVANAAQQIALPPATPHPWLPWAVMGAVAVIIGIGSFMLGMRRDVPATNGKTTIPVSNPIEGAQRNGGSDRSGRYLGGFVSRRRSATDELGGRTGSGRHRVAMGVPRSPEPRYRGDTPRSTGRCRACHRGRSGARHFAPSGRRKPGDRTDGKRSTNHPYCDD